MSGINKSKVKNPMPVQEPQVRAGNFSEVALGYTKETAVEFVMLWRQRPSGTQTGRRRVCGISDRQ